MYQIKLNGRFLFHSPNLNLINQIKSRYFPSAQITFNRWIDSIAPPVSGAIYTEFDRYLVNNIRQEDISATIRSNVSADSRLDVNSTVTFKYMTFLRIPPTNWTNTGMTLRPTLSVISGGTIDGGSTSKQFFSPEEVILNPIDNRVNVSNTAFYDTYKMKPVDDSTTTLTPGTYNINLITGPFDANRYIAMMSFSQFPIRTEDVVHPSAAQPSGRTSYFAMSLTN